MCNTDTAQTRGRQREPEKQSATKKSPTLTPKKVVQSDDARDSVLAYSNLLNCTVDDHLPVVLKFVII